MPPKRKSPPGGKGLRSQLKGLEDDLNISTVGKMLTRRTKQKDGKFGTLLYSFHFGIIRKVFIFYQRKLVLFNVT